MKMLLDPAFYADDGTMKTNARAAVDMFMYIVPIASGILAFWFASRGAESDGK